MARVDNLANFLTDVANSIREKKGTTDQISASSFDTEISSIQSGTNIDINDYFNNQLISTFTDAGELGQFYEINVKKLFKQVPDFHITGDGKTTANLFQYYSALEKIGKITNDEVTNTSNMFDNCTKLKEVDLTSFSTSTVINMNNMFSGCISLETLDLHNFVTTNLTNTSDMFYGCTKLKNINMSNFTFNNITSYDRMFGENYSESGNYRIPTDCYILVKDATAKEWITSKFDWLTNVHYVGEA